LSKQSLRDCVPAIVNDLECRICTLKNVNMYDTIRYDTIRDAILTCAEKQSQLNLPHGSHFRAVDYFMSAFERTLK